MLFEAVNWSIAGLAVLAFIVMRSEVGPAIFGRRRWQPVAFVAAITFLGVAYFRPPDLHEAMSRIGAILSERVAEFANDWMERAGAEAPVGDSN